MIVGTLSFREVASQTRFAASMDEALKKPPRSIKRAAFPAGTDDLGQPTFDGEEAGPLKESPPAVSHMPLTRGTRLISISPATVLGLGIWVSSRQ